MKNVKVTWFHNLKGFGEGVTDSGDKVFLKLSAVESIDNFVTIRAGQQLQCKLEKQGSSYLATSIALQAPHRESDIADSAPLRVVEAN